MRALLVLLGFAAVQAAAVRSTEQLSENPIRRIVNLLQMMQKEIEADGEKDEEMTEKCGGFDVIVFRSVSFGYLGVSYSICTCWNIEYWRAGRFRESGLSTPLIIRTNTKWEGYRRRSSGSCFFWTGVHEQYSKVPRSKLQVHVLLRDEHEEACR